MLFYWTWQPVVRLIAGEVITSCLHNSKISSCSLTSVRGLALVVFQLKWIKVGTNEGENTDCCFLLLCISLLVVSVQTTLLCKNHSVLRATVHLASGWTRLAAQRLTFILASESEVSSLPSQRKWVGDGRGWKREMERGKMIGAGLWFIYKAWGKKPPHLKLSLLSQRGKDGLPSLKWHSHVLPASGVLSLESENDAEKKKTLMCVKKHSHPLTLRSLLLSTPWHKRRLNFGEKKKRRLKSRRVKDRIF